jgi:hypothetical protein
LFKFIGSQYELALDVFPGDEGSQKERIPLNWHINPGQQGPNWLGHCIPRGVHLPAIPVPLRETICGLPGALSVMLSAAVRVPDAVGLNLTLMLQLAPAGSELPQVWVCTKSPALVPVIAMLLMVKLAVPVLLSVTIFGALVVPINWAEKVRRVGDKVAFGREITVVSLNAMLRGLLTNRPLPKRCRSRLRTLSGITNFGSWLVSPRRALVPSA